MSKKLWQGSGGGKKGFSGFPVNTFLRLSDTPDTYAAQANKFVTVRALETGLEFTDLPPLAITDTFVVASEAAMLALTAQRGDVAVRTDINQTFILQGNDPAILANWVLLLISPTHAIGGAIHTADTLANLKTKISAPDFLLTSQANEYPGMTADATPADDDTLPTEDTSDGKKKKIITVGSIKRYDYFRNHFRAEWFMPNALTPHVYSTITYAEIKYYCLQFRKATQDVLVLQMGVPHFRWNRINDANATVNIHLWMFPTTAPGANNATRWYAKAFHQPQGQSMDYAISGSDMALTKTVAQDALAEVLFTGLAVNLTGGAADRDGVILVKISRDKANAADTFADPVYCPYAAVTVFLDGA